MGGGGGGNMVDLAKGTVSINDDSNDFGSNCGHRKLELGM